MCIEGDGHWKDEDDRVNNYDVETGRVNVCGSNNDFLCMSILLQNLDHIIKARVSPCYELTSHFLLYQILKNKMDLNLSLGLKCGKGVSKIKK